MKAKSALSLALAAGIASTAVASNTPTTLSASNATPVNKVAHIYFNIASGEKVITLLGDGQTAPADIGAGGSIWAALDGNACSEEGFTISYFFGVDDNSAGGTPLATAITNMDMGDIAANTVVDCIHINWVTDHDDVDADSDGIGDGVLGLAGQWTINDIDNARELDVSTRAGLISFIFTSLPGDTSGTTNPNDPANTLAGYTADIDLTATFSSSLAFEICDTDGDAQGVISHTDFEGNGPIGLQDNNFDGLNDSDLDGDGLADWTWSVRFYQPGTADLDSDGILDGDIADGMKTIGIGFGSPEGTAIDNGDGSWTWDIDTMVSDPGTGAEDAFAIFEPPVGALPPAYAGFFWFGGFACIDDGAGGYNPPAHFEFQMFGPGGITEPDCPADLNGDGVLNFFDVSQFLGEFAAGGDYNGDGVTNFFDVSAFLGDFNAGCPTP